MCWFFRPKARYKKRKPRESSPRVLFFLRFPPQDAKCGKQESSLYIFSPLQVANCCKLLQASRKCASTRVGFCSYSSSTRLLRMSQLLGKTMSAMMQRLRNLLLVVHKQASIPRCLGLVLMQVSSVPACQPAPVSKCRVPSSPVQRRIRQAQAKRRGLFCEFPLLFRFRPSLRFLCKLPYSHRNLACKQRTVRALRLLHGRE